MIGWAEEAMGLKITDTKKYRADKGPYMLTQQEYLSNLSCTGEGEALAIAQRLLGYGEDMLNRSWPVFVEKVGSGGYDKIEYDEIIEPDGFFVESAFYDKSANLTVHEAIESGKPYKDNPLIKDFPQLEWDAFKNILFLAKVDINYAFMHPIMQMQLGKFDSVPLPKRESRVRDSHHNILNGVSNQSAYKIASLFSEIASKRALDWHRINSPELFKR
ncbi:MAG: hypothetical protein JW727_05705 [Candidatus Aenigmarchaeota archaeon]|nr:hypothetical protein [Candidatus Aenigmarchaeota archaeon]